MTTAQRLTFTGDPGKTPVNPHKDSPTSPEPYVISDALKKAVNLAVFLRRPLLLEGDAGCGKTRLAYSVAYELGLPLYRWDIRSSTRAQDGLYEYDAILRLHDVEVQKNQRGDSSGGGNSSIARNPGDPKDYRTFGPLGKAFQLRDRAAVVLIDEIDKADLDFPNDLLTVLDEPWEFTIRETGETITAHRDYIPIVMITSNREKTNLPAPFLRRCLYRFLDFPNDSGQLKTIVERHYQIRAETPPPDALKDKAVDKFLAERQEHNWFKPPGTSEFLDWLKALHEFESEPYDPAQLTQESQLPYPELLIKRQDDWRNLHKAS